MKQRRACLSQVHASRLVAWLATNSSVWRRNLHKCISSSGWHKVFQNQRKVMRSCHLL